MKVQKMIMRYLVLLLSLVLSIGCKKEIESGGPGSGSNPSSIPAESAGVILEVAQVLEDVYRSRQAVDEVEAAIQSGYYLDERVLLRDLLFPETSDLYKLRIFIDRKIDTGAFRRAFCREVSEGNYPKLKSELGFLLKERGSNNGGVASNARIENGISVLSGSYPVAIYFPYSENFPYSRITDPRLSVPRKPTIVAADRDADNGPGKAPFFCHSNPEFTCYRDVIVNDDYAYVKATHIITTGAELNPGVSLTAPPNANVNRVYHGASKLTRQMDRLISIMGNGGGSEIKVCRINGYLRRQDEQIDDFAGDVVTLHYSRGDIRNRRWKRVYSVWDPNWNYQDIEQIYAVYEEDTKGSRTIDGSLRTSLTIPGRSGKVEGDIGFKIQISTQDEVITQRKIDRKSYFYDALNNQGWGFLPDPADFLIGNRDWPVYDGGSIWQYTFPYRVY
jgi:hypothetical protein